MKFYVSFSNGERVTFPKVIESSIENSDVDLGFKFGENGHKAVIMKDKINFVEFIDED